MNPYKKRIIILTSVNFIILFSHFMILLAKLHAHFIIPTSACIFSKNFAPRLLYKSCEICIINH